MNDEKKIKINNDTEVQSNDNIVIHISYNEMLSLKELSEIIDNINKAINDVNRSNGVKANTDLGQKYASKVSGVEAGSIVLHILVNFVSPVALGMLGNFLYDRLKNIGVKKKDKNNQTRCPEKEYPISINVNGNENLIELHIDK